MSLKKLKKICCGLLASTGVLSSSQVLKAAEAAASSVVDQVKVENKSVEDLLTDEPGQNNGRDILPIGYSPVSPVVPFDLDKNIGEEEGFETERLSIEPLDDDSISSLLKMYDESVYHWMSGASRQGMKLNARRKLSSINPESPRGGKSLSFVVKEKTTHNPVGVITASIYPDGTAKYSYWLGKEHRGKGYAQESMIEFNRRVFANPMVRSVGIRVFDDNGPSLKLKDKMFKDLNTLYPNNLLSENVWHEKGINISHHLISKFTFDPQSDTFLGADQINLSKINYDDLVGALTYLLDQKVETKLPESAKTKLQNTLDSLKSGNLKLDNSSYIYIVSQIDSVTKKLAKSNGFVYMNAKQINGDSVFEISYVNDDGVEGVNDISSQSCFLLAKNILCGTSEKKVKIKSPAKNTTVSQELIALLDKDESKKILKVTVEKDKDGNEEIFIEKKSNENIGKSAEVAETKVEENLSPVVNESQETNKAQN